MSNVNLTNAEIRKRNRTLVIGFIAFALIWWVQFLVYHFAHVRIFSSNDPIPPEGSPRSHQLEMQYLYTALGLSIATIILAKIILTRRRDVMHKGIPVAGRIVHTTGTRFVIEYEYGGKSYEKATSDIAGSSKFLDGTPMIVYVHPDRPTRAIVVWKKFEITSSNAGDSSQR